MFGALANKEYVAPADNNLRHNDNQSDDEEPKLKKMMKDKFGHKSDDGGDTGATGASAAGTPGASSTRSDEENYDSHDNEPEPGYEFYLDDCGDECLKKKGSCCLKEEKEQEVYWYFICTTNHITTRNCSRSKNGSKSWSHSRRSFHFDIFPPRSTEPPHVVTSATEMPTVTSQADPARTMASTIRATTSQLSSERR
ncbi:hypothetical protein Hanom_Chr10g00902881 [Helianthus anomalus]